MLCLSTDMRSRIREHTWMTETHIINTKLLPYFGKKKVCEIQTKDVIAWQNELLNSGGANGKGYSPTYLKTCHNQLSAILNHAVRHYELKANVAAKVGPIGKKEAAEMLFWTKDEYFKFADAMMDKPVSYYAFEVLYWCGLRLGKLLALTPADFDFAKETVSVTKSYQRLKGADVITAPKPRRVCAPSRYRKYSPKKYKNIWGCSTVSSQMTASSKSARAIFTTRWIEEPKLRA